MQIIAFSLHLTVSGLECVWESGLVCLFSVYPDGRQCGASEAEGGPNNQLLYPGRNERSADC